MITFWDLFPASLADIIGETIFHSLWQGFLITGLYILFLRVFKQKTLTLRYNGGLIMLALWLMVVMSTFGILYQQSDQQVYPLASSQMDMRGMEAELFFEKPYFPSSDSQGHISIIGNIQTNIQYWLNSHGKDLALIWIIGVCLFSLKWIGSIIYVHQLKSRYTVPVLQSWEEKVKVLSHQLGIQKDIGIKASALVNGPVLIGYLKPVILLPLGMLSGLQPEQVEAVIIHELAHVKRNDYLINLLVSLTEILFFYHPAYWWLSSELNKLREQCCDEIAVEATGDALLYVKTLVEMEEKKNQLAVLAMGMQAQGPVLMQRVRSILQPGIPNQMGFSARIILSIGILLSFALISWRNEIKWSDNQSFASVIIEPLDGQIGVSILPVAEPSAPEPNGLVAVVDTPPPPPPPTPEPVPEPTPAPVPPAGPQPVPPAGPQPVPTAGPQPVPTAGPQPVPSPTPKPSPAPEPVPNVVPAKAPPLPPMPALPPLPDFSSELTQEQMQQLQNQMESYQQAMREWGDDFQKSYEHSFKAWEEAFKNDAFKEAFDKFKYDFDFEFSEDINVDMKKSMVLMDERMKEMPEQMKKMKEEMQLKMEQLREMEQVEVEMQMKELEKLKDVEINMEKEMALAMEKEKEAMERVERIYEERKRRELEVERELLRNQERKLREQERLMRKMEERNRALELDLKKELLEDGIIKSKEKKLKVILEDESIKVNGKSLEGGQFRKYKSFLKERGYKLPEQGVISLTFDD